jgi:hypothetical protein
MNSKTALIGVVIVLAAVIVLYRSCAPGGDLNVDPHAREEIEKAKGR